MTIPRPSCLRGAQRFGRTAFRRTANQARSSPFRNAGRRTYASGHEAKQSSDLPWMIGAVVFTVPAAAWLYGQGPDKSSHGDHGHDEAHEEGSEEPAQETDDSSTEEQDDAKAESTDDPEDESQDTPKETSDDAKSDTKDQPEEKSDDGSSDDSKDDPEDKSDDGSSDDTAEKADATPDTPDDEENEGPSSGRKQQYFRNPNKKPGEGHKGERAPTEKKGEKDAQSNFSGAKHPYIDDADKRRKAAGPIATARIHGTAKPTYANEDATANRPSAGTDDKPDQNSK